MVHLNYAINIWLFLNNKGSHTTSRHKRRDDKEKRYGSHMAGWGERSLCVKQPSQAARPVRPSGKGVDSSSPPFSPHLLRQVFAKISRWGNICLRGLWRTIEGVFAVEPDEKEVCNPVVFLLPHTVNMSCLYIPLLSGISHLIMCARIRTVLSREMHFNNVSKWNHSSWLYWIQTILCSCTMISLAARKTNYGKAKYYSAFNCNKQMVAKLKEITYTLSSLYGFALIEAIITPTFLVYNEVN